MRVISLFAGIGGFDLAFTRAGAQIVAHVEIDPAARAVLARHWPDVPQFDDVRSVGAQNLPACDVVCGGFPCQDLSVAGNRAGLAGARSGLFYDMVRIIDELRPSFLLWENVPGLLSSDSGRDFARILRALDDIGYSGCWTGLDAQFFGLAQRRQRIFGLWARGDIGAESCAEILALATRLPWNTQARPEARADVAGTLAAGAHPGSYNGRDAETGSLIPAAYAINSHAGAADGDQTNRGHAGGGPVGLSNRGHDTGKLAETLRADSNGALPMVMGGELATSLTAHHGRNSGEDTFIAFNFKGTSPQENIAPTMTHGGEGGDPARSAALAPAGVRRLTPLECERLQGFPDEWTAGQSDSTRYRQLGNAVAVPVVEWIARRMVRWSERAALRAAYGAGHCADQPYLYDCLRVLAGVDE